jgi:hypothetical protein
MRTKQELRESYAKATGWESWENLKFHSKDLDIHINDLIDMALYDQKYTLERSQTNPQITEDTEFNSLLGWNDINFPDDEKEDDYDRNVSFGKARYRDPNEY